MAKALNVNELVKEITLAEGKKQQVSIAQVKEVVGLTLRKLAQEEEETVLKTVAKFKNK